MLPLSLPTSLVELFSNYDLELADYQMARFVIENDVWDSTTVLTRETENNSTSGKVLRFL